MNIRTALHLIKDQEDPDTQMFTLHIWDSYYQCQKIYHQLRRLKCV
jgi:hypothetical protein